jgi:hypothetical protein
MACCNATAPWEIRVFVSKALAVQAPGTRVNKRFLRRFFSKKRLLSLLY